MPKYLYIAKSQRGETKTGVTEAASEYDLARALRQEGYVLISAEVKDRVARKLPKISLPFLDNVPFKEKMMFARNLKVMVAAGVTLPKALKTLAAQTGSKKLSKVISAVAD